MYLFFPGFETQDRTGGEELGAAIAAVSIVDHFLFQVSVLAEFQHAGSF